MRQYKIGSLAILLLFGGVALWRWDFAGGRKSTSPELADEKTVYSYWLWSKPGEEFRATGEEVRKAYPFESLSARLAYEKGYTAPPGSVAVAGTLDERERLPFSKRTRRAFSLRKLHYEKSEEFFRVPDDNGFVRTPPRSAAQILLEEKRGPIPTESSPYKSDALGPEQPLALSRFEASTSNLGRAPSQVTLRNFAEQGAAVFLDPERFGYYESIDRVAGFIPHEFYEKPDLGSQNPPSRRHGGPANTSKQFDRWLNTELQLVSLLKHPEPRVYKSRNLPAMNELIKAETRGLDGFERGALPRLQAGEEVVIAASTNEIRMLGALRARQECRECHSVERHTLLGAFSYVLERDPPISAEQVTGPAQ